MILDNGGVPQNVKDALLKIVDNVVEESDTEPDTPTYIRSRFAESMMNVAEEYRRSVFNSLNAILENIVAPEIYAPIKEQTGGKVFY